MVYHRAKARANRHRERMAAFACRGNHRDENGQTADGTAFEGDHFQSKSKRELLGHRKVVFKIADQQISQILHPPAISGCQQGVNLEFPNLFYFGNLSFY